MASGAGSRGFDGVGCRVSGDEGCLKSACMSAEGETPAGMAPGATTEAVQMSSSAGVALSAGATVKRVLFFDSGVGGLSVFQEVQRCNPALETYFLFDNECFPYGERSEDFLVHRISRLLWTACQRFELSALVVACNTASTIALPELRGRLSLPIIGVVPAIKPAAQLSKRKIIGLLATPGTVARAYTAALIADFAKDCKVIKVGSPHLAALAERRMSTGILDEAGVREELAPFIHLAPKERPDVIVLGCTHYPLLTDCMQRLLPGVRFIDSGEAIGRRVRSVLAAPEIRTFKTAPGGPRLRAFYTGTLADPEGRARMFARFGFPRLEPFIWESTF